MLISGTYMWGVGIKAGKGELGAASREDMMAGEKSRAWLARVDQGVYMWQ
jgi:hypothetical protein